MPSKEPIYDGGKYRVEYMEDGKWRIKKTGRFPARNWNHITIGYALHQFEDRTLVGAAARIVYEPTGRVIIDNGSLLCTDAYRKWKFDTLEPAINIVRKFEERKS